MITVCEGSRARCRTRDRLPRQMGFDTEASIPIGVAELPLDGTPGWPAASHCVVGNNLRLPQSSGKSRRRCTGVRENQDGTDSYKMSLKCPLEVHDIGTPIARLVAASFGARFTGFSN